jgi:hypothetical protein
VRSKSDCKQPRLRRRVGSRSGTMISLTGGLVLFFEFGERDESGGTGRHASAFSFATLSQDRPEDRSLPCRPAVFAKAMPGHGGSVPAFFAMLSGGRSAKGGENVGTMGGGTACIGFFICCAFAGPPGGSVPTFFATLSRDRPAVFAKATPGHGGSVPTLPPGCLRLGCAGPGRIGPCLAARPSSLRLRRAVEDRSLPADGGDETFPLLRFTLCS